MLLDLTPPWTSGLKRFGILTTPDGIERWIVGATVSFDTAVGVAVPCFELTPVTEYAWNIQAIIKRSAKLEGARRQIPPCPLSHFGVTVPQRKGHLKVIGKVVPTPSPDETFDLHRPRRAWIDFCEIREREVLAFKPGSAGAGRHLADLVRVMPWALFVVGVQEFARHHLEMAEGSDPLTVALAACAAPRRRGRPSSEPDEVMFMAFLSTCKKLEAQGRIASAADVFASVRGTGPIKRVNEERSRRGRRASTMVLEPLCIPINRAFPLPSWNGIGTPQATRWALNAPARRDWSDLEQRRALAAAYGIAPRFAAVEEEDRLASEVEAFVQGVLLKWAAEPRLADCVRVLEGDGHRRLVAYPGADPA